MLHAPERSGLHINTLFLENYAVAKAETPARRRPLAERKAYPPLLDLLEKQGVPIGDRSSPYTDSRKNSLTNLHALEGLGDGEKQQLRDSFAWLRKKYFDHIKTSPQDVTAHHLFQMALIGVALPNYLMLRARERVGREDVPAVVGNLYKASLGLRDVAGFIKVEDEERIFPDGKTVYTLADENHWLYNRDPRFKKFTCAASRQLIMQVSDALLSGGEADSQRSELDQLIPDEEFGNLVRFSDYNFQFFEARYDATQGRITFEEFYAKMVELQPKINDALGRDGKSIDPPLREDFHQKDSRQVDFYVFVHQKGGLVDTAQVEIYNALAEKHREDRALAQRKFVRQQPRRGGSRSKRKDKRR